MVSKEQLEKLATLEHNAMYINAEIAAIRTEIKESAEGGEDVTAAGYRVYWKPGSKSTEHEKAAMAANVSAEIIKKYTTIKEPSIAWAKVTKEAKVDVKPFTTQGDPIFTIKAVK